MTDSQPADPDPADLGVECTNAYATRQLAWLRRQVGDDAIRAAVARLPGSRRPWPLNVAKVLRITLPEHLGVDPSTPAAFFASARALLSKKSPRS